MAIPLHGTNPQEMTYAVRAVSESNPQSKENEMQSPYSEEGDWAEGARCIMSMHAHTPREMPCRAVFTYCLHSTADIYLHEQKSSGRRVHTQ